MRIIHASGNWNIVSAFKFQDIFNLSGPSAVYVGDSGNTGNLDIVHPAKQHRQNADIINIAAKISVADGKLEFITPISFSVYVPTYPNRFARGQEAAWPA